MTILETHSATNTRSRIRRRIIHNQRTRTINSTTTTRITAIRTAHHPRAFGIDQGIVGKHIGRGWVRGFTITGGAIASTIGHDSHNVCVVGDSAADMMAAVEAVGQGGHVLVRNGKVVARIPLALGGLMSEGTAEDVAAQHDDFMVKARAMGIEPPLDPIMGIIFLPLPVIPTLRIRPEGMFDVTTFTYAD